MEIEIQNQDFDKLLFPVNLLGDNDDPLKVFGKLNKWAEFKSHKYPLLQFNKIFKWIVFVYDMNSPFQKINDIIKRKVEVARYVKLFEDANDISDDVKKILLNEDKAVNRMLIAYVRMHRESKYAVVVALEQKFYNDLLISQDGKKVNPAIEITQKKLEEARSDLFSHDNTSKLRQEFNEYMEEERIDAIRPEIIADLILEGKKPILEEETTD